MKMLKKKPFAAFTLIELLTVIAIIGILAAILIPVVGSVRENARQAQCGSNQRQIALAVLMYESENNALPGPIFRRIRRTDSNDPDLRELNWIIEPYIGGTRLEVWDCPSNSLSLGSEENRGGVVMVLNNSRTRTVPPRFFGYPGATEANGGVPKRLSQIERAGNGPAARNLVEPSQIWLISDADGWNYDDASIGAVGGGGVPISSEVGPVHNNGRNYVFFDGHLEYRLAGSFPP